MHARWASLIAFGITWITLGGGCGAWSGGGGSRPGLGTSWGETRSSEVRSVEFDREDPERPTSLAMLYYDDGAGLRELAGSLWGAGTDHVPLARGAVRVRLLDERGEPLPHFEREGRHYVRGRPGERYTIEVDNRGPDRFEAVTTVDGLDVMDGQRGSPDKRGYLIHPYARLNIDGFRRNMAEVAAFRFGAVEDSYAARTGDDRNVGIIGVALFAERGAQPRDRAREAERRRSADPFPGHPYPGRFAAPPPGDW